MDEVDRGDAPMLDDAIAPALGPPLPAPGAAGTNTATGGAAATAAAAAAAAATPTVTAAAAAATATGMAAAMATATAGRALPPGARRRRPPVVIPKLDEGAGFSEEKNACERLTRGVGVGVCMGVCMGVGMDGRQCCGHGRARKHDGCCWKRSGWSHGARAARARAYWPGAILRRSSTRRCRARSARCGQPAHAAPGGRPLGDADQRAGVLLLGRLAKAEVLSEMLEGALRQNEREPVSASTVVRIIELSDKVQTERFRLRRVRKDKRRQRRQRRQRPLATGWLRSLTRPGS